MDQAAAGPIRRPPEQGQADEFIRAVMADVLDS
jgi:hypothetical protein